MISPQPQPPRGKEPHAFTLVELLTVVAIMALIMGLMAISLTQSQGRGVQMAAAQVASGMGLARQTAITRNTDALFIVAPRSGDSPTNFFPAEPFRYWAVVYSNRNQGSWSLATDWAELPASTIFLGLTGEGYNTINWNTNNGVLPAAGTPFRPLVAASRTGNWQHFNNYTNLNIVWPEGSISATTMPFIGFRPNGRGFALRLSGGTGAPPPQVALLIGEGSVAGGNELVLRSTNNITHVETDSRGGRVVIRPRESYR